MPFKVTQKKLPVKLKTSKQKKWSGNFFGIHLTPFFMVDISDIPASPGAGRDSGFCFLIRNPPKYQTASRREKEETPTETTVRGEDVWGQIVWCITI